MRLLERRPKDKETQSDPEEYSLEVQVQVEFEEEDPSDFFSTIEAGIIAFLVTVGVSVILIIYKQKEEILNFITNNFSL